jgi:hypothetical protein
MPKKRDVSEEDGQESENKDQEIQVDWETVEIPWDSVQIDWGQVEIPEDKIREHPAYEQILAESIRRRKEIARLKNISNADADADAEDVPEESEVNSLFDLDTVVNKVLAGLDESLGERIQNLETVAQSVRQQEEDNRIQALATTYNLSEEDTKFLKDLPSEQREGFAKRVGKKVEDSKFTGNGGDGNKVNPLITHFQSKRAPLEDPADNQAFSTKFHKEKGGGAIINE